MYIVNKTSEFLFTIQCSHWSRPGSPPPRPPAPPPVEAFVGVGGTLVHFALRASDYLHLLTCVVFISIDLWSVMKFLIIWFLMVWFDQNLWLTDHKVAIKKKNSPNTVKLIQKVLPRKEITCSSQKTHIIFRKTISLSLLSHNAIIHSWCTSFL